MKRALLVTAAAIALGAAATANARPVTVHSLPSGICDDFGPSGDYHELGVPTGAGGYFPDDEEITGSDINGTDHTPCFSAYDDPETLNVEVMIVNMTGKAWHDLWFVADELAAFANVDADVGEIGGDPPFFPGSAFRIDDIGANTPLTLESMTADGIFEVDETWIFTVQDWGGAPVSFGSIGIGGASDMFSDPFGESSASIIAREYGPPPPVPEPATLTLFGLGLLGLGAARRRNRMA
ncbi:MAG: PEP-CTERM sorting domain-containing protein [Alphaproteobacteria bacterium]|jgi:hypothetical protein|nr:PEP-CTERM sorting domain-containing protein [Alphaproteobacteria bacterium]MDP6814960.1 PEP-CTERM sorting domain-containing protein [Alphaproteobacteria bacterium]